MQRERIPIIGRRIDTQKAREAKDLAHEGTARR